MPANTQRLGIGLMIVAMFVFGTQDALSRHLAAESNTITIVWIRYWAFVVFVFALAAMAPGGFRAAVATKHLGLQITRGVALVVQLCMLVQAFTLVGLSESHALFACYPLIVVALSGLVLGEKVPLARWGAVALGLVGVLVILRPGAGVFAPEALLVLGAATIFAAYSVMTRRVGRDDAPTTSLFWTAVAGGVAMSVVAPFFWKPPTGWDWAWMALLCVLGITAHAMLIKVYRLAEANTVQPFAYLQLLFATGYGVLIFGERPDPWTALGAAILIGAGLMSLRIKSA
jgi:drug/metabolite transporter (DMT)-like permease